MSPQNKQRRFSHLEIICYSMDIEVDHYTALDLPSGKEGAKLSEIDISKAYRKKALELHPDKRPDDPINVHSNFQICGIKKDKFFLKEKFREIWIGLSHKVNKLNNKCN